MTERDAIELARRAVRAAHPESMLADAMGWARLIHREGRAIWSVESQTIGSQLVVELDAATGAILSFRRAGLR